MSVFDPIKKLFSKKASEGEQESRLSLAMPDDGLNGNAVEAVTVAQTRPSPLESTVKEMRPLDKKPAAAAADSGDLLTLPFLGTRPLAQQQRLLGIALGASLLVLAGLTSYTLSQADKTALQLGATGQAMQHLQRLAHSATQSLAGHAQALPVVRESADALVKNVNGLREGDSELHVSSLDSSFQPEIEAIAPLLEQAEKNANAVLQAQKPLELVGTGLQQMHALSGKLMDATQALVNAKVQQGASASEVAAAGQLLMLTQRIGKLSNELLVSDSVTPEVHNLLQKDLATFKDVSQNLLGSAKDGASREPLETIAKQFDELTAKGTTVLGNLAALGAARQAQQGLVADSEPLRKALEQVQVRLSDRAGVGIGVLLVLILAAIVALLSAIGLSVVQAQDGRKRQAAVNAQRLQAERQEQDAKRVNDANQAAILRLMNELQTVAEGDLTQEATVTEDITGAIADSVNYTVEELRSLVGNVQKTASQVAQTTADVDATSTELLAASKEQLHEIHATGQSVVEMAGRINNMSAQAQESARVSRLSLQAAESGLQAVQNTIGGMNAIRDQIQDTSKRIKRLGESSQEIGEITELISDITEQTNVLALNAAIQAASAGEAGRGFSVVAEEVQRLAERSADATRQIAALVKAIQTDTQDAIGAMERSTQGVVEGAKLSDNAGTALTEIDRVSRRVAELIEQISDAASSEAGLANEVAENIQHIFAVTEQTGEGTRVTAGQVRELSRMAEELRQSVSRFKIV